MTEEIIEKPPITGHGHYLATLSMRNLMVKMIGRTKVKRLHKTKQAFKTFRRHQRADGIKYQRYTIATAKDVNTSVKKFLGEEPCLK